MITQKTKHRATRTSLNTNRELRCPGRVSSSCFTCGTRRVKIFWMTENKKILNHKKCTCLIAWVRRIFLCVSICFCSYRNEVIYMVFGYNLLGMEAVCDHIAFSSLFFSYLSIKTKARNIFVLFTLSRCPLITFSSCRNRRICVNEKCPLPASITWPDRTWNVTQMHITTSELRCRLIMFLPCRN